MVVILDCEAFNTSQSVRTHPFKDISLATLDIELEQCNPIGPGKREEVIEADDFDITKGIVARCAGKSMIQRTFRAIAHEASTGLGSERGAANDHGRESGRTHIGLETP